MEEVLHLLAYGLSPYDLHVFTMFHVLPNGCKLVQDSCNHPQYLMLSHELEHANKYI